MSDKKWALEQLYGKIQQYFQDVQDYADTFDVHTIIFHYDDGGGCIKNFDDEYMLEWDNPAEFYKKTET